MEWALICLVVVVLVGFVGVVVWLVRRTDAQTEHMFGFVREQLGMTAQIQEQTAKTLSDTVAVTARAVSREIWGEREKLEQAQPDQKSLQILQSIWDEELPEPDFDPGSPFDDMEPETRVATGNMAWGIDGVGGVGPSVPREPSDS